MSQKRGIYRLKGDISNSAKRLTKEIKSNIRTAVLAALAFIIALVWRDAIQLTVDKMLDYVGLSGTAYLYKILTAFVVTIICVLGILYFSRWSEK